MGLMNCALLCRTWLIFTYPVYICTQENKGWETKIDLGADRESKKEIGSKVALRIAHWFWQGNIKQRRSTHTIKCNSGEKGLVKSNKKFRSKLSKILHLLLRKKSLIPNSNLGHWIKNRSSLKQDLLNFIFLRHLSHWDCKSFFISLIWYTDFKFLFIQILISNLKMCAGLTHSIGKMSY
jgi:hypothetical protein